MSLGPRDRDGVAMGSESLGVGLEGAWKGAMKARGATILGNERDDSANDAMRGAPSIEIDR